MKTASLKFILPLCVFAFALACASGSTTNERGIREIKIQGVISDATLPSKPRSAGNSTIYSGNILNLNDPTQIWPIIVYDDNTFEGQAVRHTDVVIEIYRNNQLALSRALPKEATLIDLNAGMNTVTHLQASLVKSSLKANPQSTLQDELFGFNREIFGKPTLTESEFRLSGFQSNWSDLMAVTATYGQLFRAPDDANFPQLLNRFNSVLSQSNGNTIVSSYLTMVSQLTGAEATAFASAHEGAQNSRGIDNASAIFASLADRITSQIVKDAIQEAKASPIFGEPEDALRPATVGAIFQFTFPEATTDDILGISAYQGVWESEKPSGILREQLDQGRTLMFLPSSSDLGKVFVYRIDAHGGNGKVTASDNIAIEVRPPVLTSRPRKKLPNHPLFGPLSDSNFLYLLTRSDSGHELYLDKIPQDFVQASGTDTLLTFHRWTMPATISNVYDATLYKNILYVAGGSAGIFGFDTSFLGQIPSSTPPTYESTTIPAKELEIVSDRVIAHQWTNGNVQSSTLTLSGNLKLNGINSLFQTAGNIVERSGNTALYEIDHHTLVASTNIQQSSYRYDVNGNLQFFASLGPTSKEPIPQNRITEGLPLTYRGSDNTLMRLELQTNGFTVASNLNQILYNPERPHRINGDYLFYYGAGANLSSDNLIAGSNTLASGNLNTSANITIPLTLSANSLSGNLHSFKATESSSSSPLFFQHDEDGLRLEIVNLKKGTPSHFSGSWIYSIGTDAIGSDNWFMKAHLLEASDSL